MPLLAKTVLEELKISSLSDLEIKRKESRNYIGESVSKEDLRNQNFISQLRFITCGSVDDGKSTLIGRLLHDTGSIFEDQMEIFRKDSQKFNTTEEELDFSLLVDGLSAEREQGITIDVAYRYFSTPRRFFIIADTPGHEQYIRNMATGASLADLAIILIDARKGVLPQTRRHSFITSMVGIRSVVIAVNKMDLVGFDPKIFERIVREYKSLLPKLNFEEIVFIPLSARFGHNVVELSNKMPWYNGPALFEYLEKIEPVKINTTKGDFYLPVQWINRPNSDFRGICGTVSSGALQTGEVIRILPGGQKNRIKILYNSAKEVNRIHAEDAVTLSLEDESDVSRGDVLVSDKNPLTVSKTVRCQVLWMSAIPLDTNKKYLLKLASMLVPAHVDHVEEKIDIHSYCSEPTKKLSMNEIGHIYLKVEKPLVAIPYSKNRTLGALILIEPIENETVALGIVKEIFSESIFVRGSKTPNVFSRLLRSCFSIDHEAPILGHILSHLAFSALLSLLGISFGLSPTGAVCLFAADFLFRPVLKNLF